MRESAHAKGHRLLVEGRVRILEANDREIRAVVTGDSAERYEVTYQRGGWVCACPSLGRCSHLVGVMLVTFAPTPHVREVMMA